MTVRRFATALFWVFAVAVLASPFVRGRFLAVAPIGGFGAFYCAGVAIRTGHDPYLVEPLRTCEASLPSHRNNFVGNVEPAPLPPFVLPAFALLSYLPFPWAIGTFTVLLVVAIGAAAWALERLISLPLAFVGATLLIGALYHNILFGEIPPLVIGTLCVGALLIERGRCAWGALVAAASVIEPHVAAPVLISLFIFLKPARLPLAGLATVLVSVSVFVMGLHGTIEYFSQVIPLHALSEVAASDQYSLTWVLHEFGLSDALAVRLGTLSYVGASVGGIAIAFRLAKRYRRPAFLVFVPAVFAMVGGTFIHDIQLPIALPAALLLLAVSRPPVRAPLLVAMALLALPWYDGRPVLFGFPVLAMFIWQMPGATGTRRKVLIGAGACVAFACSMYLIHQLPSLRPSTTPIRIAGEAREDASVVWRRFVSTTRYGQATAKTIVLKLPLWLGLLGIATTAVVLAAGAGPTPSRSEPSGSPTQ